MSCHGRSSLQIVFSRAIIATACLVTDDHRCKMFCHGRSSVQLGVSRTFIATFRRFSFLFFPLPPSYFFFFCFSLSFSFISPPLFSTDLFALSVPFCNSTRIKRQAKLLRSVALRLTCEVDCQTPSLCIFSDRIRSFPPVSSSENELAKVAESGGCLRPPRAR